MTGVLDFIGFFLGVLDALVVHTVQSVFIDSQLSVVPTKGYTRNSIRGFVCLLYIASSPLFFVCMSTAT
jgi:hypothetical protein